MPPPPGFMGTMDGRVKKKKKKPEKVSFTRSTKGGSTSSSSTVSDTKKAKSRTKNAHSSSSTVSNTNDAKTDNTASQDDGEGSGRITTEEEPVAKRSRIQGSHDEVDAPSAKKMCDQNDQQAEKQDEAVQSEPTSKKIETSDYTATVVYGQELPPDFAFQSHVPANGRKTWSKYFERLDRSASEEA